MKSLILIVFAIVAMASAGSHSTKESERNLEYEAYCDSIWEANPDYYLDVIMEQDEYCNYIEEHGKWW